MSASAQEWIILILVGGLFGMVGQGIRVVVGLKKVYDQALQEKTGFSALFSPATLLFSLLIGFVAGVLGMLGLPDLNATQIQTDQVLTLIGIGYAGADFIEGFIKKQTTQFKTGEVGGAATNASSSENLEQPPVG